MYPNFCTLEGAKNTKLMIIIGTLGSNNAFSCAQAQENFTPQGVKRNIWIYTSKNYGQYV